MNPSITINNITYRGDINGYDLFVAICSGFWDIPEECKGDHYWEMIRKKYPDKRYNAQGPKLVIFVLAFLGVIVVNLAALYFYRRYSKKKISKELQRHVKTAVSQYFKLPVNNT